MILGTPDPPLSRHFTTYHIQMQMKRLSGDVVVPTEASALAKSSRRESSDCSKVSILPKPLNLKPSYPDTLNPIQMVLGAGDWAAGGWAVGHRVDLTKNLYLAERMHKLMKSGGCPSRNSGRASVLAFVNQPCVTAELSTPDWQAERSAVLSSIIPDGCAPIGPAAFWRPFRSTATGHPGKAIPQKDFVMAFAG